MTSGQSPRPGQEEEDIMAKKDEIGSQNITGISLALPGIKNRFLGRLFLFFVLLLIPTHAFSITIIKKVGHGDCYVVISDGRVVVIDVGPRSSNGLVSL